LQETVRVEVKGEEDEENVGTNDDIYSPSYPAN
jgi:hypothetical protein